MSLKVFHILFITISTLLVIGFAAWLFTSEAVEGGSTRVIGGIGALAAAIGLVLYGRWFLGKFRKPTP